MPTNALKELGTIALPNQLEQQMPLFDAQRLGAELYGAPQLSPFDLFEPNENTLSRIIAFFLNPKGEHGQGPLFLNALLGEIGFPKVTWRDVVSVKCESSTAERRRIDIVIETPKALLGIENKPWAGQQPNQLNAYYDDLNVRSGGKRFGLLFLSDQEEQSAKGKAIRLPYAAYDGASLLRVLSSVLNDVKAPKAREFLADFLAWVEIRFGDGTVPESFKRVYVDALEAYFDSSASHRKAIAAVMLANGRLCERALDAVGEYIVRQLQKHFDDIEFDSEESLALRLRTRWTPWLVRRKVWPPNCNLAIEADQTGCHKIVYGVRALDPKTNEAKKSALEGCSARPNLNNLMIEFAGGGKTAWWPWRQFCEEATWNEEFVARLLIEADGEIEQHPFIQALSAKLVSLAHAIGRLT